MQKIEGIDQGEAFLISATAREKSFYLTTGDKRCIRALAKAPEIESIQQRLVGRVICLEQVIKKIIEFQGFNNTLTKILPVTNYDTALKSIFGSGSNCTQKNVMLSLDNYIQDLRNSSGNLLSDF